MIPGQKRQSNIKLTTPPSCYSPIRKRRTRPLDREVEPRRGRRAVPAVHARRFRRERLGEVECLSR